MKKILLTILAATISTFALHAQTPKYSSLTVSQLLELSSNGDACATDAIGDCYALGNGGVKIDKDVAYTYYKKSIPGLEQMV